MVKLRVEDIRPKLLISKVCILNDYSGLAGYDGDGFAYTTLMYANGPGYNDTRFNVTANDTRDWEYTQLATVPKDSETHGGDDVSIYATGERAILLRQLSSQELVR